MALTQAQIQNRYEFIDKIESISGKIPWQIKSGFVGQACKESGFGASVFYNNFMGIKCHNSKKYAGCRIGSTGEVIGGVLHENLKLAFQAYNNLDECRDDYVIILNYVDKNGFDRYKRARESRCYQEFCYYIKACGYATGLKYDSSLRNDYIIPYNLFELDLQRPYKSDILQNYGYLKWYEVFATVKLPNKQVFKRAIEPPQIYWENINRVAIEFQKIRSYYNLPIQVDSFYRVVDYNQTLKGHSDKSMHLTALAVDLKPLWRINIIDSYKKVKEITNFKGFGIGSNYLHCDLRDTFAIWTY